MIKADVRLSKWLLLWDLLVGIGLGMVRKKIWDVGGVLEISLT